MVSRTVLLALIAQARGCIWVIEQPFSSLMREHPRMKHLMDVVTTWQITVYLGNFGANSVKPLVLYSNSQEFLANFSGQRKPTLANPVQNCRAYVDRLGIKRVVGLTQLKATQAYPPQFGHAVAAALDSMPMIQEQSASAIEELQPEAPAQTLRQLIEAHAAPGADIWADADLTTAFEYLRAKPRDSSLSGLLA